MTTKTQTSAIKTVFEFRNKDFQISDYGEHVLLKSYKLILLGEASVGKTTFGQACLNGKHESDTTSSIGVDLITKYVEIKNNAKGATSLKKRGFIRLNIWDTAGQERFESTTEGYIRDSNGVFILFDITNIDTLKKTRDWYDKVTDRLKADVPIYIIGNKIDQPVDPKISSNPNESYENKIKQTFEDLEIDLEFCSAKTGAGIEGLLHHMLTSILKNDKETQSKMKNFIQNKPVENTVDKSTLKNVDLDVENEDNNENKKNKSCNC